MKHASRNDIGGAQSKSLVQIEFPGYEGCGPPGGGTLWQIAFKMEQGTLGENRLYLRLIFSRAGDASITLAWH